MAALAHSVELFFPIEDAAPVLRGWRDLSATAPRAATFYARVGECEGPAGGEHRLRVGRRPRARPAAAAALRALGRPIAERVDELPYVELQRMEDTVEGHALRRYWKGHYFRSLTDEAIDAFLLRGTPDGHGERLPAASLQHYGGAIADVPDGDSAFSQRDAMFEFVAAARWTDPAEDEQRIAAARRYAASLEPFASGMYVNAMSDEGASGVARAYRPEKLARLRALKTAYDPDNVFHLNHNIEPA